MRSPRCRRSGYVPSIWLVRGLPCILSLWVSKSEHTHKPLQQPVDKIYSHWQLGRCHLWVLSRRSRFHPRMTFRYRLYPRHCLFPRIHHRPLLLGEVSFGGAHRVAQPTAMWNALEDCSSCAF
ncbi:hypothetical protein BJX64DRAFT_87766 [Aspergillus heterothallicus]